MKNYKILHQTIVMSNPDSIHNYFGWPSIAKLQDGRLAAVASGFRIEHLCPFGKAVISYSDDGGKSWTAPTPVIDTILDDRDAGILAYGESTVLLTSFNNKLEQQGYWANDLERRTNESTALTEEEKKKNLARVAYVRAYLERAKLENKQDEQFGSTYRISHDCTKTWGPLRFAPVTSPHGPTLMQDGRILYVGTMHGKATKGIFCYIIDEEGNSEFLAELPHIPDDEHGALSEYEPYAIVLPNGKIIVHIRGERYGEHRVFGTWQSVSTDGGKTFSVPEMIGGSNCAGAPAHILRHSSGKLISAVGNRKAPYGINILTSDDDGETWELGTLIPEAESDDLGYPCSCELPDGSIYTVWYQHHANGQPAIIHGANWILE